jgi:hypothetical protein
MVNRECRRCPVATLLKTLWKILAGLLRILLYGWVVALVGIMKAWCRIVAQLCAQRKLPERERKTAASPCVPIREPSFVHPDPMIYSQFYLMQLGFAVTWDNPDIQLLKDGVPVPSGLLARNTAYEIVARIWNNSNDAPIKSLPVRFSVLSFGIGTRSDPLGSAAVDLGVKGGPNHPAFAHMKWRTPDVDGHYCLQVFLDWLDDTNPFNNLGQENTNVGHFHSPAAFDFVLRNATTDEQTYRFEADTYQIPDPSPCGDRVGTTDGEHREGIRMREARMRHDRRNYPVPQGWEIIVEPDHLELVAAAERTIRVSVAAPDGFRGRMPINVHAFYGDGKLAGGVTLYVESS